MINSSINIIIWTKNCLEREPVTKCQDSGSSRTEEKKLGRTHKDSPSGRTTNQRSRTIIFRPSTCNIHTNWTLTNN